MTAALGGREPVLRFEGVSKRFGRRPVLRDVFLTVSPGEAWTIRGANGSGKSTLLRLAAGLARPSSGTVEASASRAFVPATVVMPRRTPLDRLLSGLSAMTGVAAELEEALEILGCRQYLDQPADTLSTGTALKALLAQALTSRARLVVLDEPAAHLDDDAAAGLVTLIEQARERGAAVLTAGAGDVVSGSAVAELADGRLVAPKCGREGAA